MSSPENPKVSVLISTFNRPQYLAESIESIRAQTFTNWELIILNDGGVDVAGVVENFADPRIIYVPDTVNRGAAVRFNQGLNMAHGDYVCYLGDDDIFYPNHFELLARALDEHPEAGLAYSDLYATSSVSDGKTGRRHIMDKQMLVSRDFNREFMFHYNHVLHVSLMHRREAAIRVGGFDEEVKVLIEWSLNRRLAFLYDFIHVEQATGEYHMAVFKSDRISVRERRNQESYKHNLRKIRCIMPEEPWSKVERIDLLYLVDRWGPKLNQHIREIIDNFDHPMRIKLIGNGSGLSLEQAWDSLKELKELKNIEIFRIPQKINPVIAYRKAAKASNARFLFLVTPMLKAALAPRRLFSSLEAFKEHPELNALRWGVEEEKKSIFECLIYREYFLNHTKPSGKDVVQIPAVTIMAPKGFKFDIMYGEYQKLYNNKEYDKARTILDQILSEHKGFPHIQFLIKDFYDVCLATKDYDSVDKALVELIERGYEPDNLIRLTHLRRLQGRWSEAVEAGKKAMASLNLTDEDLEADCFPFKLDHELGAFKLMQDIAESLLEMRDYGQSARYFHMASKINSGSHKPFLGFAKTYLAAGQLERAEATLMRLPQPGGKNDPESHRLLATVCRRRKNLPLAFECLQKAFELGPTDEQNVEPFYFAGAGLGKWREMVEPLKNFVLHNERHAGALARLASVHFNLGEEFLAREAAERALAQDERNPVAKSILDRLNSGRFSREADQTQISMSQSGLTLEINPEILPGLLDSTAIVW